MFAPPRVRVWLRYSKVVTMSNATNYTTNVIFIPTAVYDVDPTIGSTTTPGFVEWGTLYRTYRLTRSRCEVQFVNNEQFGGIVFLCAQNDPPTANQALAITNTALAQPTTESTPISAANGNSSKSISKELTSASFTGAADVNVPDFYAAPTGGSSLPSNNWYWNVGFTTGQLMTAPPTGGIYTRVIIDMEVEFNEVGRITQ